MRLGEAFWEEPSSGLLSAPLQATGATLLPAWLHFAGNSTPGAAGWAAKLSDPTGAVLWQEKGHLDAMAAVPVEAACQGLFTGLQTAASYGILSVKLFGDSAAIDQVNFTL